jgi:hypothetical protein
MRAVILPLLLTLSVFMMASEAQALCDPRYCMQGWGCCPCGRIDWCLPFGTSCNCFSISRLGPRSAGLDRQCVAGDKLYRVRGSNALTCLPSR